MITNKITVQDTLEELEPLGIVCCPWCGKGKTAFYPDSAGHSSQRCDVCHNFMLIDFDRKVANKSRACRGIVLQYKGHKLTQGRGSRTNRESRIYDIQQPDTTNHRDTGA